MPRQARLDAPGILHHVMIRGIERGTIFRNDKDRKDFLARVGELVKKTRTRILAWFAGSALMGILYDRSPIALAAFSVAAQLTSLPLLYFVHKRLVSESP